MRAWYLLVLAACAGRPLDLPLEGAADLSMRDRFVPDLHLPGSGGADLVILELQDFRATVLVDDNDADFKGDTSTAEDETAGEEDESSSDVLS